MPLTAIQPLFKEQRSQQRHMSEMSAVASAGLSAELVSFQRHHASIPPDKNVNSATVAEPAAGHFSGKIAFCVA